MKAQLAIIFSIFLSGLLCLFLPNNTYLIIFLPGILFGLALTLPNIYSKIKESYLQLKIMFLYPILWLFTLWLSAFFQFIIKNSNDKIGYVIIGLISGMGISFIFDWQFGFRKKINGYIFVSVLSIMAILVCDYFFPTPKEKELYITEYIAVWQILVGFGIFLNRKKSNRVI